MSPTAPSNLLVSPSELSAQGSWGSLVRTSQAMLHDSDVPRATDLEALRSNGLAMRAEGQMMAEHGQVMLEDLAAMEARHSLDSETAQALREAASTMGSVGHRLRDNGQAMIDYADRLRRSMGYRTGGVR
jgi:hypothetical protein